MGEEYSKLCNRSCDTKDRQKDKQAWLSYLLPMTSLNNCNCSINPRSTTSRHFWTPPYTDVFNQNCIFLSQNHTTNISQLYRQLKTAK
jgi:hypothetical protein